MGNRIKIESLTVVPQDKTGADAMIRRIGEAQRERQNIETAMNEGIAALKAAAEERAKPVAAEIELLTRGIQTWCAAHRDELTDNGKRKFYRFGSGDINWRDRPPKVSLRGVDSIIDYLKTRRSVKFRKFLRVKFEVNKEAMLADAKTAGKIEGVKIGSAGEDFVITPLETKLEQVA